MPASDITGFPPGLTTESGLPLDSNQTTAASLSETAVCVDTLSVPPSNIEQVFVPLEITTCCEREQERTGWFHRNG
jgi:hypothetical protein